MRKIFLVLVAIILLALTGLGVFAYTVIFEPPREAMTESFRAIATARSFHQDMAIKVVMDSPSMFTAEVTVATDVEQPAAGSRRIATVVTGKSAGFSAGFEIRSLDETLYGKVIEFPFLFLLDSVASTSPIGKWFSVSFSEIESYALKQSIDLADIAKVKEQISKIGQTKGPSQSNELIEQGVFVFGHRATLVRVDGGWVRQYTMTIDKDKLTSWLTEIDSDLPIITDSLKTITFDPMVVTMDLFNHSLKSITGGIGFPGFEMSSDTTDSPDEPMARVGGKGVVSYIITYRDINGPITVTKPANAAPLIEYLEQSINEAKNKAKIKAELPSLRAE